MMSPSFNLNILFIIIAGENPGNMPYPHLPPPGWNTNNKSNQVNSTL